MHTISLSCNCKLRISEEILLCLIMSEDFGRCLTDRLQGKLRIFENIRVDQFLNPCGDNVIKGFFLNLINH